MHLLLGGQSPWFYFIQHVILWKHVDIWQVITEAKIDYTKHELTSQQSGRQASMWEKAFAATQFWTYYALLWTVGWKVWCHAQIPSIRQLPAIGKQKNSVTLLLRCGSLFSLCLKVIASYRFYEACSYKKWLNSNWIFGFPDGRAV